MIAPLKKLHFLFIVILAFCLLRAIETQFGSPSAYLFIGLTGMEAFCGQAYLAMFISWLVGRYVATAK